MKTANVSLADIYKPHEVFAENESQDGCCLLYVNGKIVTGRAQGIQKKTVVFGLPLSLAAVFGTQSEFRIYGEHLDNIFPGINLESSEVQYLCARGLHGHIVPCAVTSRINDIDDAGELRQYFLETMACTSALCVVLTDFDMNMKSPAMIMKYVTGNAEVTNLYDLFDSFFVEDSDSKRYHCVWNRQRDETLPPKKLGVFYGLLKHVDGSHMTVKIEVKTAPDGFQVQLSYDCAFDLMSKERLHKNAMGEDDECTSGEYSNHYQALAVIGTGAFGTVKLSKRKHDETETVTKFIKKTNVLSESWVASPRRGGKMIPIEILILESLTHPNIVQMLDIFENRSHYCLVMGGKSEAMDLYDFIEKQPALDDSLICYIFRQIAHAVHFLHQRGIVHRDIKDENVIIDNQFHVQLIDFGSAAYYGDNIIFSTFCGTMQYASPEIHHGRNYRGPEVEMWLLGILLYTLVYRKSPFITPEETKRCFLYFPWVVSEGIRSILEQLLHSDPILRATMDELLSHKWLIQEVCIEKYNWSDVINGRSKLSLTSSSVDSAKALATQMENLQLCKLITNQSDENSFSEDEMPIFFSS